MNGEEARRRIGALTALVQALMREVYCGAGPEKGRALFDLQLKDDELLAMAIRNELDDSALREVFSATANGPSPLGGEVAASPLSAHLSPWQRRDARVALLGHREADDAHTLAVRAPGNRGSLALSDADRVRLAEEVFLGRMEIDALHERDGWSGFEKRAHADTEARLGQLPQPWRRHARRRLAELRARVRETLTRP